MHRAAVEKGRTAQLSELLQRAAVEFGADRERPLDLIALCRDLDVGFRIAEADGRRRGALIRGLAGWEVVLMRRGTRPLSLRGEEDLERHERFTIAHELGHYVLTKETSFRAQRNADYWLGESLCNQFASALLIQNDLLADLVEPSSSAELANAVGRVARAAGVTHEPAARAIAARLQTPVALGSFRLDPWPKTERLGYRGWWVENRCWWGGGGGRRLAVYTDHALAPVLRKMRVMRPGQAEPLDLAGAHSARLRRSTGTVATFSALLT
jgi:hypothetical protein